MSKLDRGEKGEAKVNALLEGIAEPRYVFHDVTLVNATSEMTHQIDHILVHPHGVFVIETKNYYGQILYDEASGEWSKVVRGQKTRTSNPLKQNKSHAITLRKALKGSVHPIPVVVYARNNAPYLPDENVINAEDLSLFVESYPYPRLLTLAEMAEIKRQIEEACVEVSKKEHLENIAILKQVRKETQAEMAYAIEQGLCPRCDHKIVVEGYEYHCPNCGYRFKL